MDDGGVAAAQQQQLASRRRLMVLLAVLFGFFLFTATDRRLAVNTDTTEPPADGTNNGSGKERDELVNLKRLAREIELFGGAPIYPANISLGERFMGQWSRAGLASINAVTPRLTPNISIQYVVSAQSPPSSLGFGEESGAVRMQLVSSPFHPRVPSVQRVEGVMLWYDGMDVEDDAIARRDFPISGWYLADEGIILAVSTQQRASILFTDDYPPPKPERSTLEDGDNATTPDAPNSTDTAGGGTGSGTCDLFMALRFRPIGMGSAPSDISGSGGGGGGGGRRLSNVASGVTSERSAFSTSYRNLQDWVSGSASTWWNTYKPTSPSQTATGEDADIGMGGTESAGVNGFPDQASVMSMDELQDALLGRQTHAHASKRSHVDYSSLIGGLSPATANGRKLLQLLSMEPAPLNGGRQLSSANPTASYPGAQYLPLHGRAVSPNCGFTFNVSVAAAVWDEEYLDSKSMGYALLATCCGIVIMTVLTYQIVQSSSQSSLSRISVLSIGLQTIMDAYLTLFHMVAGMVQVNAFSSFATTSFVQLVLFSVLEMRFMLMIWKARHQDAFSGGWESVRREVGALYCRFYLFLIAGLTLVYFWTFGGAKLLTVIFMSFWWPQIWHSAQHDSRPALTRPYIITTSVARLLIPLYFLVCPYNIMYALTPAEPRAAALSWGNSAWSDFLQPWMGAGNGDAAPWVGTLGVAPALATPAAAAAFWSNVRLGIFLTVWMLIQCVVLLLQTKMGWGPRWFVPREFLPSKYDYHRLIEIEGGRIVPNPAATTPWLRGRAAPTPAATAAATPVATDAAGAPVVPPPPGRASQLVTATVEHVRARWLNAVANATWLWTGVRLVIRNRWTSVTNTLPARGGSVRARHQAYERVDTGVDSSSGESGVEMVGAPVQVSVHDGTGTTTTDRAPASGAGEGVEVPGIDCLVCLDALPLPMTRQDYMVTPCDHLFHTSCLRPWLEQKLECPTCRMQLPEPGLTA